MNVYNPLKREYWFGQADTRPLSVFRIAFAAILVKNALYYLPLVEPLYSDSGAVRRSAVISELGRWDRFSLMDALSTPWMAALFILVWAAIACGLLVGYRTRLMTVLNFICILSVQERNTYVLNGADLVLRVLSFWVLFVPLGDYYSIDAVLARVRRFRRTGDLADLRVKDEQHTTYAFPWRMAQIQFALIYLFTALLKLPSDQWWHGEATYNALQIQSLTLPTGDWLRDNAPFWVFRFLSRITLIAEFLFFWLVFLPILQPFARLLGMIMVALLHIGIMVAMSISDFSTVMLTGYLLFFDPRWIKRIDNWLRARREPVTLPPPASPDDPAWLLLAVTADSEVAVDERRPAPGDERDPGWQGLMQAMGHLPLSKLWLWSLRFAPVRAGILRSARWLVCYGPLRSTAVRPELPARPVRAQIRVVGRIALAAALSVIMVGVIWVNLLTVTWNDKQIVSAPVPAPLHTVVNYLGLWQSWFMFAPYPSDTDGWIIIPGVFEDGTTYDLRTGQPPANEMPHIFFGPLGRWRKFEENVRRDADEPILRDWARSYCIYYNVTEQRPVGRRLATLKIIARIRRSHALGAPPNPLEDVLLWTHYCY